MSSAPRPGGKAWASLVLGILAFALAVCTNITSSRTALLLTGICFLLAVLLGVLAKIEANRSGGRLMGKGRVPIGIVIAACALVPLFVGAAESVRWTVVRISGINNLKSIGLAMQAYQGEHGRLPPAAVRDPEGRPLLSWRVLLLPYLEDKELYKQFRLDEAWDSPHNKALLDRMPGIYRALPGNPSGEPNTTFYQVFVGKGTAFAGEELALKRINAADGCANTVLVVEAAESVPWTKPADLHYATDQPLPPLGDLYRNEHYVNPRGRFLALFADGSVRCFFHDTPERLLRPLITWNGGEEVDWNQLEPWCRGMRGEASLGKPRP
ncbi:MAG TPA: DUF1559 domain-containing protein [Gemmataceae bacterium]|nr:DUF1559 domain-containing protein [Gemmataceae bacterium]